MTTERPQPINKAAGGASNIERVLRSCWLTHQWGQWVDTSEVKKESTIHGGIIAAGVQQERRCQRCNKVQLRTAWD